MLLLASIVLLTVSRAYLDIVVEHGVPVSERLKVFKCMLGREIFELYKQLGEGCSHLRHELLHELRHLLVGYTAATETKVERVIEELLIIRPEVEADRDGRRRPDTEKQKA